MLEVTDGASLFLEGAIDNTGVIAVDGTGDRTSLVADSGDVTLSGGGSVVLGAAGLNIVTGYTSAMTLTNLDNTISGAGQLGSGTMRLVNGAAGVIDANASVGLILDTVGETVTNAGLIEATGAGGLVIRNTSIDDSGGGVILAGSGSHIALQGADLIGGTLESAGTGAIKTYQGGSNTLDGRASALDNEGKVVVQNGTALTVEGAIVNTNRIDLISSGSLTTLTIGAAGATLSGGGAVVLTANANNVITGASSAATLTNVDNNISGAGLLGAGAMTLVNQAKGVINANRANAMTIDTGGNIILNAGIIEATGAGGLTIAGDIFNTGLLKVAGGTLTVNGSVGGNGGGVGAGVIVGGTLYFKGAFNQNVFFKGATGVLESGVFFLAGTRAG